MASSIFMTADELFDLSGKRLKSGQCKWLQLNRIPFLLNAAGQPRVARDAVLARLGAPVSGQVQLELPRAKPNFGALKGGKAG